jgi:hypothetical protein
MTNNFQLIKESPLKDKVRLFKDKVRLSPALSRVVCLQIPRAHAATVGACKRRSLPRRRGEAESRAHAKNPSHGKGPSWLAPWPRSR